MIIDFKKHSILGKSENKEYSEELQRRLSNLQHISCPNVETKIKELISNGNETEFLQGVAELMLWFLCENKQVSYSCDTKTNGNKSCDLQFTHKDFTFNVEVKSPVLFTNQEVFDELNKGKPVVQIGITHRSGLNKKQNDEIQKQLMNMIQEHLSTSELKDTVVLGTSLIDNPLFEALAKASEQLPKASDQNINIVFIPTATEQMGKYMEYLKNPQTGIFTRRFNGIAGNSWKLSRDRISNISGILLSNAFEGKNKYSANRLDLEETECFFIDNDNYDRTLKYKEKAAAYDELFGFTTKNLLAFLGDTFKSHQKEFLKEIKNRAVKQADGRLGISVEDILGLIFTSTNFLAYVNKKNNKKNRKRK